MTKTFSKILIANRGEIALRINRAAKDLGIKTVAIYTENEGNYLHVREADFAVSLGTGELSDTYLNIEKIISIAKSTGAEAIHPGYGFLSENADFAEACTSSGLIFIGPMPEVLRKMGNKIKAKEIAVNAGVKVLSSATLDSENQQIDFGHLNFPLLIKASHGGGGKGMQIVRKAEELQNKLMVASRSAKNYFGNGEVYVEDYIENARHIEVQILGDQYGNLVHLFERDCTIQRNHQKIIEEAPATCINDELRTLIHQAALKIGQEVGYQNAGTVEFLVDQDNHFYFLEMNPRIQVEHTVTEQITGIDLVKEQFRIAVGKPISFQQEEIKAKGHAIELRVYQEDIANNFSPSTKHIQFFQLPDSSKIRIETDLTETSSYGQFDPLLLKMVATAPSRLEAIQQLEIGLKETYISGPVTNLNYLRSILNHHQFVENEVSTTFLAKNQQELIDGINLLKQQIDMQFVLAGALIPSSFLLQPKNIWEEIGFWRMDQSRELIVDGIQYKVGWNIYSSDFSLNLGHKVLKGVVLETSENVIKVKADGKIKEVVKISFPNGQTRIGVDGFIFEVFCTDVLSQYPDVDPEHQFNELNTTGNIYSHLHGKIVSINIKENQTVNKGETMMVIESMKSENAVIAPKKAKVKNIAVAVGEQVTDGMTLVFLEDE